MLGEKYFQMLMLILVHSITLILIFFKTSGLLFRIEFALFVFFFIVSILFLFGLFFEEGWAWVLIMLFFGVNLVNVVSLKFVIPGNLVLFGILFVIDGIGFIKSIANVGEEEEDLEIEPYESEERKTMGKLTVPMPQPLEQKLAQRKHKAASWRAKLTQWRRARPSQRHAKKHKRILPILDIPVTSKPEFKKNEKPLVEMYDIKTDLKKVKMKYDPETGKKVDKLVVKRSPRKRSRKR